ncbi:MAG: TorF family putative porin [Chlamydiales bacterium]
MNLITKTLLVTCFLFIQMLSAENGNLEEKPSELTKLQVEPTKEKEGEKKDQTKEKKSPHTFKATLTIVTDYRDRGISQTMRQPAVQGEFDYAHSSGFYFKTWASNVDGTGNFINNTSLELDFYLGIKGKYFQTPFEFDAGLEFYYYPGGEVFVPHRTTYNTLEFYAQFSYKKFNIVFHQTLTNYFGVSAHSPPINWNKNRTIKPNGRSIGSPYFEANWEIPYNSKLIFLLHAGCQIVINYPQLSYVDWLVTLTYKFEWFDASLSYVASNARHAFYDVPDHAFHPTRRKLGGPGIYAGISRSF